MLVYLGGKGLNLTNRSWDSMVEGENQPPQGFDFYFIFYVHLLCEIHYTNEVIPLTTHKNKALRWGSGVCERLTPLRESFVSKGTNLLTYSPPYPPH